MVKEFFREFGLEVAAMAAGFAGALASVTREKELSIGQRFLTVTVGGLIAGYTTPLFSLVLNMNEEVKYGVAFILGYSGLRSVEWVIQKWFKKPTNNDSE